MRDAFGFVLPVPQQETKTNNNEQDANFKGMYVSTNGYYGFQPLPQKEQERGEHFEFMDVQMNDSGIQFNNFIAPEDRLSGFQEVNVMRGSVNRKRRWSDDAPLPDLKKRRETDTVKYNPSERKLTQVTLSKNSADDLLEQLLRETHGCSVYHWMGEGL